MASPAAAPVFPAGRFYAPYMMPRPAPDMPNGFLSSLSADSGIRSRCSTWTSRARRSRTRWSAGRRNAALALVQAANPGIQVSYTLPVNPTGLAPTGVALFMNAMSHGVKVAVVNLMTMDYGGSADPASMGPYAINAVNGADAG